MFHHEDITLPSLIGGIAVGQLLFSLPFYLYFKTQKKHMTCRGLIIGASVSCLIGAACGVRFV